MLILRMVGQLGAPCASASPATSVAQAASGSKVVQRFDMFGFLLVWRPDWQLDNLHIVMAGLVPSIHVLRWWGKVVDARHKAGHDGGEVSANPTKHAPNLLPTRWSMAPRISRRAATAP